MAINKILKIEGANITWTCKQISKMVEKETLSFRNVVQRSFCWEKTRMSELIWSIVMGFPVPSIYAERRDSDDGKVKIYDVLDGQQRCTTIRKYLNNEFALSELNPILYLDENDNECSVDISGLMFSELDEEIQDIIKDATITVKYFDNLDQSNKAEMFRRLNNGKPLSTKSRMLASCKDIEGLLDIGSHKLFDEMMTDKARANKNQVAVVMKIWCMMYQDVENVSFESKVFNPMLERTEITEAEKLAMIEVFNLIVDTHDVLIERKKKKIAKKLYTETHMVSLIPYFKKGIEDGVDTEMMADWLIEFFGVNDTASVSEEYNAACTGGSAKNVNVVARHDALADSYAEFFKFDDECDVYEDDDEEDDEIETDVEVEDNDIIENDSNDEDNDDFEYPELYKSVMDDILGDAAHYND